MNGLNTSNSLRIPEIVRFSPPRRDTTNETDHWTTFYALLFPATRLDDVLGCWRDTGSGMSSRQAEHCLKFFDSLKSDSTNSSYCTRGREDSAIDIADSESVVGLPSGQAEKQALKRLIAHLATSENNTDGSPAVSPSPEDVFLFSNGMSAIYTVSRALASLPGQHEAIGYG